jgi:hypothetical protein
LLPKDQQNHLFLQYKTTLKKIQKKKKKKKKKRKRKRKSIDLPQDLVVLDSEQALYARGSIRVYDVIGVTNQSDQGGECRSVHIQWQLLSERCDELDARGAQDWRFGCACTESVRMRESGAGKGELPCSSGRICARQKSGMGTISLTAVVPAAEVEDLTASAVTR